MKVYAQFLQLRWKVELSANVRSGWRKVKTMITLSPKILLSNRRFENSIYLSQVSEVGDVKTVCMRLQNNQ